MMGKRVTRMVVAALVFAIVAPLILRAVGTTGPFILIPLVALAFWWMARHTGTDDEDDTSAPRAAKASAPPVKRVPSGKRVTPPKPKGRRVTPTPTRTKARKR